jgi:molecular chaperone DnaK (HSP70)
MLFLGIDLGTTNCSLAYSRGELVEDFAILQAVGEDLFEKRYQLPSYAFLTTPEEAPSFASYPYFKELGSVCGHYARSLCERRSGRVVQSAKSWISLSNTNSCNRILPFSLQQSGIARISPAEASALYLKHIRLAFPGGFPADAAVVVTVPASFDELARRLTIEAAELAGFPEVVLLEEPQAAFYNWLYYEKEREKHLKTVLVVDIGGGTTDFSLLRTDGAQWKREAVGNHILLGGDNIDLALALKKEQELGRRFTTDELEQTVAIARDVKERFLDGQAELHECHLKGSGSKLFSSGVKLKFTRAEVEKFILDGFFPLLDDFSATNSDVGETESGLREFGLPYEKNPAFSYHMREFLKRNCPSGPDAVLFHGGCLQSDLMCSRLRQNLEQWFKRQIRVLKNPSPLLGVSHGACIYALARSGQHELIRSGLPHNYYLKAELGKGKESCFCIAASGQQEGDKFCCPQVFQLKGNRQVAFPFYRDSSIEPESAGAEKPLSDLQEMPLLVAKLPADEDFFPVRLSSELMPTGELKIYLDNTRKTENFVLNFEIRSPEKKQHRILKVPKAAEELIQNSFGRGMLETDGGRKKHLQGLLGKLEKTVQQERGEWGIDFCRHLGRLLVEKQRARRKSPEHERAWFNLAGFLLRPGFGHPLDADLFAGIDVANYTVYPNFIQNRVEYWIFLRRIAGGLNEEFQRAWFQAYSPYVFGRNLRSKLPGAVPGTQELGEMLRAFVAFEYLSTEQRAELFQELFKRLRSGKLPKSEWWLFGRILSRKPTYAGFAAALDPELANPFFAYIKGREELQLIEMRNVLSLLFSQAQEADRRLQFAESQIRDLSLLFALDDKTPLSAEDQQKFAFGETLPLGLKLYS